MDTLPANNFLMLGLMMIGIGLWGSFTGRMSFTNAESKHGRDISRRVLKSEVLVYTGWLNLGYGLLFLVVAIQKMQAITPNILDTLVTLIHRFVRAPEKDIMSVVTGIAVVIVTLPLLLTWIFGETKKV